MWSLFVDSFWIAFISSIISAVVRRAEVEELEIIEK